MAQRPPVAFVILLRVQEIDMTGKIEQLLKELRLGIEGEGRFNSLPRRCGKCGTIVYANRTKFRCPYCGKVIKL